MELRDQGKRVDVVLVLFDDLLLLGKYVLGEQVGPRRLIACVVGFIGTLLVIQPSFAQVGAPALLPLIVAVVFALFMLVTRQIAKETDPVALSHYLCSKSRVTGRSHAQIKLDLSCGAGSGCNGAAAG